MTNYFPLVKEMRSSEYSVIHLPPNNYTFNFHEMMLGLQEVIVNDNAFSLAGYGKRQLTFINFEKSRDTTDTIESYNFTDGTEPRVILKMYAIGLAG